MPRFDRHFRMNEQDAVAYAREKLAIFGGSEELTCREIGDGNINYVFRIKSEATGKSVIIKHADVSVRSTSGSLSTDRNRIEAEILQMEGRLAPGMVPEVYLYDPVMCCLAMEDLSDHEIMRYALMGYKTFDGFAEAISGFLVDTLLPTTDLVMDPVEKKELVKRYINPELCRITESLVYTEPYTNNRGRNVVFAPNEEFVRGALYGDAALHLEVAKLKIAFENNAQALIHGDLHTGSIFVKPGSVKVIDPEFAFYGPIGYDVGNVIANLFFAWARARVGRDERRGGFLAWLDRTAADVIDLFKAKFMKAFREQASEAFAGTEGFAEWYLGSILEDTAGITGMEMNRRIVGSAKVKDITTIEDPDKRALAERIVMLAAKELILRRARFTSGSDYVRVLYAAAQKAEEDFLKERGQAMK
jgi:5-methylthioribose kinase